MVSIAQALRMTEAQAILFKSKTRTTEFGPGWDLNSQPSDLWANT